MTELTTPFAPDYASPPGETILDIAEERGWTQAELSRRLGYTEKHISQVINGKVPLSVDAAQRLQRVLGSTVDFWLLREANYQKHKARLEEADKYAGWVSWLDELPLKALMDSGAIAKRRIDARTKPDLVEACLRFFGVASPEDWRAHYKHMQLAFRRSHSEQSDMGAISAWLRLGELQAENIVCRKYSKTNFEKALRAIRKLTCEQPKVFEPRMRKLLQEAGILLVLVPSIPRAHVSGVARWLRPTQPLIQLSLYGKTNDKFWFNFFHEAAHILLHSNSSKEKKSIYLDDLNSSNVNNQREREANEWAANWLIPPKCKYTLPTLRSKQSIRSFAKQINVHPGIIVGRLQHESLVKHSQMNDLKQKFGIACDNV
ncbi:MAG: helix-turn-helix domain-containing protein [Pseudohongiellaceae bacterium]